MKKEIIPAIIAKSQKEMEERINHVKDAVEWLQLDVMDGKFVPNTSLNFDIILPKTSCMYEAQLRVSNPEEWIIKNHEKVDIIIAHFESSKNPGKVIELIKSKDKKASFAINPETTVEKIKPYLNKLDHILVMTVNPGFYGSKFLPETLAKVTELRSLRPQMEIEVDGGITDETIAQADSSGANLFVSGSFIQKNSRTKDAVGKLRSLLS